MHTLSQFNLPIACSIQMKRNNSVTQTNPLLLMPSDSPDVAEDGLSSTVVLLAVVEVKVEVVA